MEPKENTILNFADLKNGMYDMIKMGSQDGETMHSMRIVNNISRDMVSSIRIYIF